MARDASADKRTEELSVGWIVAGVVLLGTVLGAAFVLWPRPTAWDLAESGRLQGMAYAELVTWQRKPDRTPAIGGWDMTFSYPSYLGFFDNVVCVDFDSDNRVAVFKVTEL